MTEYNVHEVLAILQKYYITESLQMVTRWIREGKIQGIRSENRREGYRVSEDDLFDYIEELRPGLPAIMEIYEEYIKNLEFQQKQSQDNIQNPEIEQETKVEEYEKEIKDLCNQIYNLETELIDLQQEKQIVEMNVIDLMEENYKITLENKDLTELFGIMDKEIIQLKNESLQINTVISESEGDVKQIKMTLDDFKKQTSGIIIKLELDQENPKTDNLLHTIYNDLFESNLLKLDLLTEVGNIKCPYTQKEYKQVKRLINNAIKYNFEKLNEQQDNQEHNGIFVAND